MCQALVVCGSSRQGASTWARLSARSIRITSPGATKTARPSTYARKPAYTGFDSTFRVFVRERLRPFRGREELSPFWSCCVSWGRTFDSSEPAVEPVRRCGGRAPGTGARHVAKTIVEIECAEVWRQISSYLDDEVDSGLRATMSSHFKECAHCSAVLDGSRNLVKLVGEGRACEIPSRASDNLCQQPSTHLAAHPRIRR